MSGFPITTQNRVRRLPERAAYDRETIYAIVDEALYCHVSFVQDGLPYVIPTNHARVDDALLLHGASSSRLMRLAASGAPLCVAFTLLDGLVLARAAFNHSVNYRSVVLHGAGRAIEEEAEKLAALQALTEHLAPGRWAEVRKPTAADMKATAVVAISIESASAKVRSEPPHDPEDDLWLPVWAGVVPLRLQAGTPIPDATRGWSDPLGEHDLRP